MADITDVLRLDIDQALRDINGIEQALDRALASVELRIDPTQAQRQIDQLAQNADQALGDVDVNIDPSGATRLNSELASVERNLTDADREAEQLAASLREADTAAEAIDVTAISVRSRFASLQTAALGIASAFAAIGVGQLFGQAVRGANVATQSFARLEDSINAVNVVFGTAAAGVVNFGEEAARSAGLSQEAFNQAVVPIGSLLQNFGFDAQQAAEGAVVLVQRAGDLASVMGGSVQDALLAVGAALRGEADPLERYGASISAARVEQFALAQGLAATKAEITPAITLQARYGLILADTSRVAGDFANTAGDLANAQRSAGAEVQNFVTDIGASLAPALETILVLLPEVLEGVRQLVPGFAAAADSAAGFFESVGQGGGFRTEFAVIRAGLESVTQGTGFVGEAFAFLGDAITQDLDGAGDTIGRIGDLLQRTVQRAGAVQLARQLDAGADAADAFASAFLGVARQSTSLNVFTDSFQEFAIAADVTQLQLRDVTQELITNAATYGLNAAEVAFLTTQLSLLNSTLFTDIEAVRQLNFETRALGEGSLDTVTTRFTTFTNGLEEIPDRMNSVAVEMRLAAGIMGEALNPFDEAAEAIPVSAKEFFANLVEQINEQATFQAGIAELIVREQFDLADAIAAEGPGAQRALDGFLNNLDLAERAEALLSGEGTKVSNQIGADLAAALASSNMAPEVQQAFIGFLEDGVFSNTQVEDAIVTGTAAQASDTISSFRIALEEEAATFDASFLAASIGAAIGASLDFSDQAAAAASATVNAYEQAFKDDFEISSPSKLMMRLGEEVAAGFLQGAEMEDMQLRVPTVPTGGTVTVGTATSGSGGGFTFAPTYVNTETKDLETVVAKSQQVMGAVAGILNGNFKL